MKVMKCVPHAPTTLLSEDCVRATPAISSLPKDSKSVPSRMMNAVMEQTTRVSK